MDFNKTIFENRMERKAPFLAAHRGICGGNIPCNTLAAYKIAVDQGADVVEIDVTKSKDGVFFVFHPFMEPVFLQGGKLITEMTAEEVKNTPLLNQDKVPTHYRVPTLQEVFAFLKDKERWIVSRQAKAQGLSERLPSENLDGFTFLLLGRNCTVKLAEEKRVAFDAQRYIVYLPKTNAKSALLKWLKDNAILTRIF